MKNIWEIFKAYYLPHLVWSAVLFSALYTSTVLTIDQPNYLEGLIVTVLGIIILTLLIGSTFYYLFEIHTPKTISRINKNEKYLAFLKFHNATLDEEWEEYGIINYAFTYRGFLMNAEAAYDGNKGGVIELTAHVNGENNTFNFFQNYKYAICNSTHNTVSLNLYAPLGFVRKSEKLTAKLNTFIDDLVKHKFVPQ